jgi:hypothetical protein
MKPKQEEILKIEAQSRLIHKLNDQNIQLKKEINRLKEFNELKRIYDWLMDENREPAQTKFTAGWSRNLAKEIEFKLNQK